MTEDEARGKWCPFTRYIGSHYGRLAQPQVDQTVCLASDCMEWRWSHAEKGMMRGNDLEYTQGYCGLGGKP